jgi:phosphomannomutase
MLQADGAISISGGHNDMGWNALTLIDGAGALLEPIGGEAVLDLYHAGDFQRNDWEHLGRVQHEDGYFDAYLDALDKHIDAEAVRKAGFTVIVDPLGGAGCAYIAPFAKRLNLNMIPINAKPSAYLPREAEPRPRSALQMADMIGYLQGDIGFLHSSDMGRMSIVTEAGEPASEEYTFALIADHVLSRSKGTLVTNCCTTRTIDDIAQRHNVPVVKTPVGQAYVVSALADEQGVLGGEGSGSAVLPAFSPAFDGFMMMALILEAMAVERKTASALLSDLPRYHIVKKSRVLNSSACYQAVEMLTEAFRAAGQEQMDLTDGIRVDRDDGWVHVRPSRTEQIVRVISEAVDRETAENRARDVIRVIEQGI